jgi:hypothetical protein
MSQPPVAEARPLDDAVTTPAVSPVRAWWSRNREVVVVTAVLGLVTWPPIRRATVGLDPSWQVGLQLATRDGLHLGRDLMFTYGPLGFLVSRILVLPSTGMLASLVNAGANFVAIAMVFTILRRSLALRAAVISTVVLYFVTFFPVMRDFDLAALCLVLFALWAGVAVTSARPVPHALARAFCVGAVAALVALVKLDAGIGCLALAGFATAWRAGLRDGIRGAVKAAAGAGLGAIGAFLIGWMTAGQSLGLLPEYLRLSLQIVQGHNLGMGLEVQGTSWQYVIALAIFAGLLWGAATMTTRLWARRIGLLVVVVIAIFITFKQGFVRHDAGHVVPLFLLGAVFPIVFLSWLGRDRTIALCVLGIVALTAIQPHDALQDYNPRAMLGAFPTFVNFAVSSGARAERVASQQREMRKLYDLLPEVTSRIAGHTVHIEPWEAAIAYAYPSVRWDPAPVFQDYLAYTSVLDRFNADFMAGSHAPDFVLRQPWAAIDLRVPRWESPDEQLQLLCNYTQVYSGPSWQLLQHTTDRCGAHEVIGTRAVHLGAETRTPEPGDPSSLVAVRVTGLGDSLTERLQTLAFRGSFFWAQGATPPWSRFLQGHQDDLHVLTGPACAITQMDGRVPYDFSRLTISDRQEQHAGSASIHLEYVEIPFRC